MHQGPSPFVIEPLLQIPSWSHCMPTEAGAPAQGFHDGFFNRPGSLSGAGPAQSVPQNSHGVHGLFITRPLGRVPIASSEVKLKDDVLKYKEHFVVVEGANIGWSGEFIYVGYGSIDETPADIKGQMVVSIAGSKEAWGVKQIFGAFA